jgi:hypothetical protein
VGVAKKGRKTEPEPQARKAGSRTPPPAGAGDGKGARVAIADHGAVSRITGETARARIGDAAAFIAAAGARLRGVE